MDRAKTLIGQSEGSRSVDMTALSVASTPAGARHTPLPDNLAPVHEHEEVRLAALCARAL